MAKRKLPKALKTGAKRLKGAAKKCKGSKDYRKCMKRELSKK